MSNKKERRKEVLNTSYQINTLTTVDDNKRLFVSLNRISHVSLNTFISFLFLHSHTILYSKEKTFYSVNCYG